MSKRLSLPDTARRVSVATHTLRSALLRGLISGEKIGHYWTFAEEQLPEIEAALRQAGYID